MFNTQTDGDSSVNEHVDPITALQDSIGMCYDAR